jgi:peptidoglycan L-alanyl-D-glutamate endopeptidase CwlK
MSHKFSKRSTERMKGVHPDLITIFNEAIKYSEIDFGVPGSGGIRTQGEQNILFQKGLSKCDGFNDLSYHQSGNALDFYAYVNGGASWDKVHLALVAGVIMSTANRLKRSGKINSIIKWGGDFGSDNHHGWDYPHFQVV